MLPCDRVLYHSDSPPSTTSWSTTNIVCANYSIRCFFALFVFFFELKAKERKMMKHGKGIAEISRTKVCSYKWVDNAKSSTIPWPGEEKERQHENCGVQILMMISFGNLHVVNHATLQSRRRQSTSEIVDSRSI